MDYGPKVLVLAQHKPILPKDVANALNTNTLLAGAMLSELSGKGLLKVSALKIGGSPLYYIPGNESQLLKYLYVLDEKDKRTVEKLKEKKIIRQTEADPLTRVSLTRIKDFAQPLIVEYEGKQETYYKWFELKEEEAKERIGRTLKPESKVEEKIERPKIEKIEKQKVEPEKIEPEKIEKPKKTETPFWNTIEKFLTTNNITLTEKKENKKTDYDMIITIPSPVGNLQHYCKARNKKRITDADISGAYVQGQIKKLPVVFLTNGELTKKATEVLKQLKGITVKKL